MDLTPLDFTEYDTRLAAYVVIVDDQDRVLLALWNELDEPMWTLPGGGVELEETPEEGAVREAREETGYDGELGRLLGVATRVVAPGDRLIRSDRWHKGVGVIYEARVVGGELTAEVGGTTDEARWFPRSEVPTLRRVAMVAEFVG